ncbi:prepilin-type N-terminal cleavage/methylation domain-containing protein [Oceanisphaera profunda]|nr:prepilin-type N-terminal cleavage/methylation domain-containing protein [Oceanisphaera profunda]
MQSYRGFTLIELVLVLLLIGIMGAVAVPRLFSNADTGNITTRDALVSRLRLVQTMNMNEPQTQRTRLAVDSTGFAHITDVISADTDAVGSADLSDSNLGWRRMYNADAAIKLNTHSTFSIFFDRLGRPRLYTSDGPSDSCKDGCNLLIGNKYKLRIEKEGYIHDL